MATENYPYNAKQLSGPASIHFAITPHDSNPLAIIPRALFCTVAGNVAIIDAAGTMITYALAIGDILPLRAHIVKSTGTTATVVGWE